MSAPAPSPALPLTVSVSDAVRLSGLHKTNLYERMAAGELTYSKVGKRRLIHYRSLCELLALPDHDDNDHDDASATDRARVVGTGGRRGPST